MNNETKFITADSPEFQAYWNNGLREAVTHRLIHAACKEVGLTEINRIFNEELDKLQEKQ